MSEEGMPLTDAEAGCLAAYLAALHLQNDQWLDWEDVPNLGEFSFDRLLEASESVAARIMERSQYLDEQMGVDSPVLHARTMNDDPPRPGRPTDG